MRLRMQPQPLLYLATRGQTLPRIGVVHGVFCLHGHSASTAQPQTWVCDVVVCYLTVLRKAFLSDITFIEYQEVKLIRKKKKTNMNVLSLIFRYQGVSAIYPS